MREYWSLLHDLSDNKIKFTREHTKDVPPYQINLRSPGLMIKVVDPHNVPYVARKYCIDNNTDSCVYDCATKEVSASWSRSGLHETPLSIIATIIGGNIVKSLAKAEEIITALESAGYIISSLGCPQRQLPIREGRWNERESALDRPV